MRKLITIIFTFNISVSAAADVSAISEVLYSKFGSFTVAGKTFDRNKQYAFVKKWVNQYAPYGSHPMGPMESLIQNDKSMNKDEMRLFNCKKRLFSGFVCHKEEKNQEIKLMLNDLKRVTEIEACIKMPSDLIKQFNRASDILVEYALTLQTLAYNQNSTLMKYEKRSPYICTYFSD